MHIPASRLLSLLLIPPVLGGVLTWSALSARAADGAAQVPAALLTPRLDHIGVLQGSTREELRLQIHLKFGDPFGVVFDRQRRSFRFSSCS